MIHASIHWVSHLCENYSKSLFENESFAHLWLWLLRFVVLLIEFIFGEIKEGEKKEKNSEIPKCTECYLKDEF